MRTFKVSELKTRSRNEADMGNTRFVEIDELTRYVESEYTALYDLLVEKFENYNVKDEPYELTFDSEGFADLPSDFYKLVGVERASGGRDWFSMRNFPFAERNNLITTEPRYALVGNKLYVKGELSTTIRIWYIPAPKKITGELSYVSFDYTTDTVTSTAHERVNGDRVRFTGVDLPAGLTTALKDGYYVVGVTTDTFQLALTENGAAVDFTDNGSGTIVCSYFGDGQTVDGVSGWEEMIVIGAAIIMLNKEETDSRNHFFRKQAIEKRIETAAQNRNVGAPARVADTRRLDEDNINAWIYDA